MMATPEVESSQEEIEESDKQDKRGWTFTANLAGLTKNRWINISNPGFGVRYVSLQTSTVTQTSYSTITSGSKAFVVSGCLPTGFSYSECTASA